MLALVTAVIAWLAVDGSPLERRASAINQALERGDLGGLTPPETARVQDLLEQLVAASGLKLPVVLNKPLQTGDDRIQVFTTRPTARAVSGTERGNAVYDAHIDTIFVDLDIVRPAIATTMYADIRIFDAFAGTDSYDYLAFVFLHELGHRVRHRGRGQLLDAVLFRASPDGRQLEREADEFALNALRAHHKKSGAIGLYTGPNSLDGEPFEVALASMIDQIVRSLLFSAVPYSPFHSDAAHPTFLSRTLGFLESKATAEGEAPDHLRLVQHQLLRIAEVATRPILEIQVPAAIDSISATPSGVSIVTTDGQAYVVSSTTVSAFGKAGGVSRVAAVPRAPGVDRPDRSHPDGRRDPANVAAVSDGSFQTGSNLFLLGDASSTLPISARSPQLFVAAVRKFAGEAQSGGSEIEQASRQLIGALQAHGVPDKAGFIILGLAGRRAHALLLSTEEQPDKRVLGAVTVNIADFSDVQLTRLDLDSWEEPGPYHAKFHAVPGAGSVDYYLIGHRWRSNGPEQTGAEICLWKITAKPPDLVTCHPLIAAAVPGWRSGQGWPAGTVVLMRTGWLKPAEFAADLHGDSVYAFDLKNRKARIIFHPGGLRLVALPGGHVVLYAARSHKAFVVKP